MRNPCTLGMIGFLMGLISLMPSDAWAGSGKHEAKVKGAEQGRGEKARERTSKVKERSAPARQDAEEWRQAWQGLSPEDRTTLIQAQRDATEKATEKGKSLTPQQKQRIKQGATQLDEHLKNLSPQQKAQLQKDLNKSAQSYASLTAEQKQEILTGMAETIEQRRTLSPEQKARLKDSYAKLLGLQSP